ncbi:hypothetical protein GCM10009634_47940 [Saccharothrix xinjiangensis]
MMSVQPRPWPEVSEQTAVVAGAAFPKGTLAMRVRDELLSRKCSVAYMMA